MFGNGVTLWLCCRALPRMMSSSPRTTSPARRRSNVVRESTSEHTEPLKFQHRRILTSIDQFGRMADTVADRPAVLQSRMKAMQEEREREREKLEDTRRRAQSAGESVEAQLAIARHENDGLRSELRIAEAARDDPRRSVEESGEKQLDLRRDLRSALSELEAPLLSISPLRPFLHTRAACNLSSPPRTPPHAPRAPQPAHLQPGAPSFADAAARAQPAAALRGPADAHDRSAARAHRASALASTHIHGAWRCAAGLRAIQGRAHADLKSLYPQTRALHRNPRPPPADPPCQSPPAK